MFVLLINTNLYNKKNFYEYNKKETITKIIFPKTKSKTGSIHKSRHFNFM